MKLTTERHLPDMPRSTEDAAMDARHRYAYSSVERFADTQYRVLDVGSGEGYGALIVTGWVGTYCEVDFSSDAVSHATHRYESPDIRFDHFGGETLPYVDNSFDLITSFQVIEHVADVERYLRELQRVAHPDARVLITTPNRRLRLRDEERPWNRYHLREYDATDLQQALEAIFSDVALFGIRGTEAMEEVERARVARARRFARWDRFGVRYVLPESVDTALRGFLSSRGRVRRAESASPSVADMWHTEEDLDRALDLLAIVRA